MAHFPGLLQAACTLEAGFDWAMGFGLKIAQTLLE